MQKKSRHNYAYWFIQAMLFGLLIMFICTYFAGVKCTEQFRESGENIKICVYCILFSFLPFLLKKWNIHSTKTLQVYFMVAIMVHFLLGDTLHFYRDVWFFSWIVHLINSFLIATIIYGMLLRHCKNQSKFFMFIATLAFTATIGVLWEFCEYAIDGLAGSNMQRFNNSITGEPFIGRNALTDTMTDLMMDVLGGAMAGLYFAFASIKGVPLYKYLELKYVKAENKISYQEDSDKALRQYKTRKEKKRIRQRAKNIKRAKTKQYRRDKKLAKFNAKNKENGKVDNITSEEQTEQKVENKGEDNE